MINLILGILLLTFFLLFIVQPKFIFKHWMKSEETKEKLENIKVIYRGMGLFLIIPFIIILIIAAVIYFGNLY